MSPKDQSYEEPEPKPEPEIYALLDPSRQTREFEGMLSSPSTGNNSQDSHGTIGQNTDPPTVSNTQHPAIQFHAPGARDVQGPTLLSRPSLGTRALGPADDPVREVETPPAPMGHPLSNTYPSFSTPPSSTIPGIPNIPGHTNYVQPNPYQPYNNDLVRWPLGNGSNIPQQPPTLLQPRYPAIDSRIPRGYSGSMPAASVASTNRPTDNSRPQAPVNPFQGQHPNMPGNPYGFTQPSRQIPGPAANMTTRPATLERKGNFSSWRGYPEKHVLPGNNLSCHEVCQRLPNALNHHILDPFLQRNWSAGEVVQSLPEDIKTALVDRKSGDNPTWLTNRMRKRMQKLITDNQWDAMVRDANNGNFLRADGRPGGTRKWKSSKLPDYASTLQSNHNSLVGKRANTAAMRVGGVARTASSATVAADGGSAGINAPVGTTHTDSGDQGDATQAVAGGDDGDMDTDETEDEDEDDDEEDADWGA